MNDDDCWEPSFLEKLAVQLEQNPRCVLAFSDHWIMREDGVVDTELTESVTTEYGRALLSEGEVHDTGNLVLKKNGVPVAMASVFRKDALDLNLLTADVVGAYDFWIGCVLAALGRPFYYVPERLTRYRVHNQSETARRSPDKSLPTVFIFEQLLQRNWFPAMRPYLKRRLAEAYFRCGRDLLRFARTTEAQRMFWKSLRVAPNWKPAVALAAAGCHVALQRAFR